MWLVFLLLIILIGFLYSNVEADLYNIDITEKKIDFKIKIYLKFFGIIKIFSITLDKVGIKVFNKKIAYSKIISKRDLEKINKQSFEIFKRFDIDFDKINFKLKIGLIDMGITNLIIIVFSSIFPNLVKNRVKRKNLKFEVLPDYKDFCLKLEGKISISIKTLALIKLYFKNIKIENEHNKNKNYGVKESF